MFHYYIPRTHPTFYCSALIKSPSVWRSAFLLLQQIRLRDSRGTHTHTRSAPLNWNKIAILAPYTREEKANVSTNARLIFPSVRLFNYFIRENEPVTQGVTCLSLANWHAFPSVICSFFAPNCRGDLVVIFTSRPPIDWWAASLGTHTRKINNAYTPTRGGRF
jgi:hypothetical protein